MGGKIGGLGSGKECEERGITGSLKEEIVQRAWRLGLLHDIEGWRGWQDDHAQEGAKVAAEILEVLGIDDPYLAEMVGLHNQKNVSPRGDPRWDIPFFCVFAADHINWGLEWVKDKWDEYERLGWSPKKAISDYTFMLAMIKSPNLCQVWLGREITLAYLRWGVGIARHIEECFGQGKA